MTQPTLFETRTVDFQSYGNRTGNINHEKDNLLIKGNNLLALHSILPIYKGKVKLIYIDPPYNTGNDGFKYNDSFNHSTWLVFMKNRLEVARQLLAEDGVIFVQIDDNEQAYLKVLMDEVFGREGFVNCIAVKMSEATGVKMSHSESRFPKLKEYLLFYKKTNKWRGFSHIAKYKIEKWDNENNIFLENFSTKQRDELRIFQEKDKITVEDISSVNELLSSVKKVSLSNIIKDIKFEDRENWLFENAYRIIKTAGSESLARQVLRLSNIPNQDIASFKSTDGVLFFYITDFNRNTQSPRLRVIFADENIYKNPCDFWQDIKTTGAIANEGGVQLLNAKKPEALLERIIQIATSEGDLVLDFFAGSGTTAAVAHKMNRRWIAIEQMDYVETITRVRLQKVLEGEQGGVSKNHKWTGGGGFVYFELNSDNYEI